MHTLQGHSNKVSCCAWSPNDTQLLTAGYDRTVKLWDIQVRPTRYYGLLQRELWDYCGQIHSHQGLCYCVLIFFSRLLL